MLMAVLEGAYGPVGARLGIYHTNIAVVSVGVYAVPNIQALTLWKHGCEPKQ